MASSVARHSFARVGAWCAWGGEPGGLNHFLDHATFVGVMPNLRARAQILTKSCRLGETTDLTVSKAVVNEGQELAGHGYPGPVLASALGNALVIGLELRTSSVSRDGFDGGPAERASTPAW